MEKEFIYYNVNRLHEAGSILEMPEGTVAVNDMPYGWTTASEWNKKAYKKWNHMVTRVYNSSYHERRPTYKTCKLCKKWHKLSGFVEDVRLIEGYDEEKFLNGELSLDKDIKSNGVNKCYCLENCKFISIKENSAYAHIGELIAKLTLDESQVLEIKYRYEYVEDNFHGSNISSCCKGKRHSVGGYKFKYLSDCDDDLIKDYIRHHMQFNE